MKKLISLTLALVMHLSIFACGTIAFGESASSDVNKPSEIHKKEMTFYLCDLNDTHVQSVYFIGDSDVPYISLEDWGELYPYLLKTYIDTSAHLEYGLAFSMAGEIAALTRTDGAPYSMTVDCAADTITFYDYDAFIRHEDDRVLIDILEEASAHSEEEKSLFRRTSDSYERYGDEVILDLGAYGIDVVADGNACYVPLQTLSDFLLAIKYVNLFYNGEAIFFVPEGSLQGEEAGSCSPLGALFYSVEPGERSKAMGAFSYAELCLVMDMEYGLKDIHGISSFDALAKQCDVREALMGTDPDAADEALYSIITLHLSDRHSVFRSASPLSREGLLDELTEKIGRGPIYKRAYNQKKKYITARTTAYPEGVPSYEEIGNTAYITFDSFVAVPEDVDYYTTAPAADAEDTIGILAYAYSQIMRENSPVENVVLDLSCNGGGEADAAVFVLSAFLGEGYASVKDTMSGALATGVYEIDLNLDGKFDENDKGLTGKKLFCLISPNSFSCGNLVPCVFKNSNDVTLIGRTSAGGSCVILPLTTAYGTFFMTSGPHRLAFMKNGSFYDIDQGAIPDFVIPTPELLYNRQYMTNYINTLLGK